MKSMVHRTLTEPGADGSATERTERVLAERLPRPWLLVATVLALTALATAGLLQASRTHDAERQQRLSEQLAGELQRRVDVYGHGLRGLRSVFAGSDSVSRDEFRRAVASQEPLVRYPASIGIGYAEHVTPDRREAFLAEVRRDRVPGFDANVALLEGVNRSWMVMKYAEPEGPNASVLGQGLGSEPRRRAAAERARDRGEPALTAGLPLRGDGAGTPGFLLLLGDYGGATPPADLASRRAAIRGWLMVALRADRLFDGAARRVDHELDFLIADEVAGEEPEVLYASAEAGPGSTLTSAEGAQARTLTLGGRDWTIHTRPGGRFAAASRLPAAATAAGGLLLAAVLGLLLRSQRVMLDHAHALARGMTADLEVAATTDRLTGLPNRRRIIEQVDLAMANGRGSNQSDRRYAVLFLDFDRFKLVNDRLGHDAGDQLLRMIGERLRMTLRGEDAVAGSRTGGSRPLGRRAADTADATPARIGGDEFVVLLENLCGAEDAVRVAERLLRALKPPYALDGRSVCSTASIGIALGDPGHSGVAELLGEADAAMYEAKRAEPGSLRVFDAAMRDDQRRQSRIVEDLPGAQDRGELRLVYQPILRTDGRGTESLEALIRWDHPELGLVPPDRFIPPAEASGQIVPLGLWILDRALSAYAGWRRELAFPRDVSLSVNLSRRQLADPSFCDAALALLDEHGVPTRLLHLEVTEREVMEDPEATLHTLGCLRATGIRIDLDDFGTGQSSLASLHRFPLDVLKIDRAFVSGLGLDATRTAVFRGVLDLARTLQLEVVAEGIETPLQLQIAESMRCDFVQGFGLSRPLRPEDVPAFCEAAAEGGLHRPRLAA